MRPRQLFVLTALIAVGVHSVLWHITDFTDTRVWQDRVARFVRDIDRFPPTFDAPKYAGHPGMAMVTLAGLLHKISGVSITSSIALSVALLNAAIIGGIFVVARQLRPHNWWWIAAGNIVLFHPLYVQMSPTNAVFAPLVVLVTLLSLYVYEQPSRTAHVIPYLGAALGVAVVTRMVESGLILGPLMIFLLVRLRWRHFVTMSAVAVAVAIIADPLLWRVPWAHVQYIVWRASLHVHEIELQYLRAEDFILFAPAAILSFTLGLVSVTLNRPALVALPRQFGGLMVAITLAASSVYLTAATQSMRYFYPLIFVWEVFLPLFILRFMESITLSFAPSLADQKKFQTIMQRGFVIFMSGTHILLLSHFFWLPTFKQLVDWSALTVSLGH